MTTISTRRPSRTGVRRPLRTAARLLATPLVPQDFLDLVDPLSSRTDLRGRIESVHAEAADAATMRIRTGKMWQGHRPGQYVRLGVDVAGVRQWRTYSITSSPTLTSHITITVKAITDGVVSDYLVNKATLGTLVHLDQATGDFTLPDELPRKALFVTAGSGITPVMGMLRTHADELDDVVLVNCARDRRSVIFGEELADLARRSGVRVIEHYTSDEARLTPQRLTELVPDWESRSAWACGPGDLLDQLEAHYDTAGLAEHLTIERFRVKMAPTGDGGAVSFTKSGVTAEADGATTLLTAGEEAGVLMPSGCRMGVCFGCVLPLRSGAVRDVRNGELTTAAPGDGVVVQTCISTAAGPCELDV